MIATLKEHVVPVLRARGFKGSFPHFRRPTDAAIHLLTFQFDRWGGGFVVEVASCSAEGVTMQWGEHVVPAKVTAHDVSHRLRLGAAEIGSDHWFRYDRCDAETFGDRYEALAREVLVHVDGQAEIFWRHADRQAPTA